MATKSSDGIALYSGAKSDTIRISFQYRGVQCRETLTLAHTKANIAYATRLRGEILNNIERGQFVYTDYFPDSKQASKFGAAPVTVTIGELLRDHLAIVKRTLRPSTYRGYKQVFDSHLEAQWDKTKLSELTPPLLRAWISTLDCKIKTVRNIITPLRNVLEQAVNDDLIEYNPLDRVKLEKIMPREQRKSDYAPDPFSMAEITAILAACSGQEQTLFQFAFATGMRTSELIALEWGSIDWIHGKVSVDRSTVEGVTTEEGKTEAAMRKIEMRQGAFDALMEQKAHTLLADKEVFIDARYGKPWASDHPVKKRWMIILKKAGVRYRNPYQTRHTFASTLLSAGENPLYVAKQMGHTDTEMITRTYGKWIEQGTDSETQCALAAFFGSAKVQQKQQLKT